MKIAIKGLVLASIYLLMTQSASAFFIGWQTFSPCTPGDQNSGVCDDSPESNIIEVYVRYLRQKTEASDEPRLIHTVRGVGYVLREET